MCISWSPDVLGGGYFRLTLPKIVVQLLTFVKARFLFVCLVMHRLTWGFAGITFPLNGLCRAIHGHGPIKRSGGGRGLIKVFTSFLFSEINRSLHKIPSIPSVEYWPRIGAGAWERLIYMIHLLRVFWRCRVTAPPPGWGCTLHCTVFETKHQLHGVGGC